MVKFQKFRRKKRCAKDRFRTYYDADKRGRMIGLRAYRCKLCNGFHLTSKGTRYDRDLAFQRGQG